VKAREGVKAKRGMAGRERTCWLSRIRWNRLAQPSGMAIAFFACWRRLRISGQRSADDEFGNRHNDSCCHRRPRRGAPGGYYRAAGRANEVRISDLR
jgi:hypothetical protein